MQPTPIVILYKPHVTNPDRIKGSTYIERVLLRAGRNVLTQEQYDKMTSSAYYQQLLADDVIVVISTELKGKNQDALEDLQQLNQAQAIALIVEETDYIALNKWQDEESKGKNRTKVLAKLASRIKSIQQGVA